MIDGPLTGGLDEVGYGALAGPYVSVTVVMRPKDLALLPPGVRDSKKTSEKQREALFLPLLDAVYDVGIGHAWPWEIDTMGAFAALQLSYQRSLEELKYKPDLLYVDGTHKVRSWKGRQLNEPKADIKYKEVSAASIIAKVFRDRMMVEYAKTYPHYGWEDNKGYGSAAHEEAIRKAGLVVDYQNPRRYLHRMSYCKKLISEGCVHARGGP